MKNTKFWRVACLTAFVISGIINAIGIVANLFGFAEGVSEHRNLILFILSFLSSNWKPMLVITIALFAVVLFYQWRRKKELERRETMHLSWFDAARRNTEYAGAAEYLFELKQFLKQKDPGFLWWSITGTAGMGKTRLVIEALRLDEFRTADVQRIESFNDYREDELKKRIDTILQSPNFNNILIAEDAQIYMDNIGSMIEYLLNKRAEEIGDHRIRMLLLIRMGEGENLKGRYKQLTSKTSRTKLEDARFNMFDPELRIEGYQDSDIAIMVKSYVETTKRRREESLTEEQVLDLQKKALDSLSQMGDKRPLFAMFIADALLDGQEPMQWNRKDVLEYAVGKRQDELLKAETRDIKGEYYDHVYEKVRGIISLSIIKGGIELSIIDDIKEEMEEELRSAGIGLKDFLKEMHLLGNDGVIHAYMPDILAEYYVLRSLVIEPDEEIAKWVIGRLVASIEGTEEFREKVRQDFRYMYKDIETELDDFYYAFFEQCSSEMAFKIVENLIDRSDLQDSNEIVLHEAVTNIIRNENNPCLLAKKLCSITWGTYSNQEEKRGCLSELRRLAEAHEENEDVVLEYSRGLINVANHASEHEEKQECLKELRRLAEVYSENEDIVHAYTWGLANMVYCSPETEEKRECLRELEKLAEVHAGNGDIVLEYSRGLDNMASEAPGLEEKRECLRKLRMLAETYVGDEYIVHRYCRGLFNMTTREVELKEKQECLIELKRFAEAYAGSEDIVTEYSKGLVNIGYSASDMEEKRECLRELKRLADTYTGNVDIVEQYNKGLYNMTSFAPELDEKRRYMKKLRGVAETYSWNEGIVLWYSKCLANMTAIDLDMEEKRECLWDLRRIAEAHAENESILCEYSRGLFNMGIFDDVNYDQYRAELQKLLSNNELVLYIAKHEPAILSVVKME